MRCTILFSVFTVLANNAAYGFPSLRSTAHTLEPLNELRNTLRAIKKREALNPFASPVDISGEHSFIPPDFSAGDERGPCPGLNALANHGYIGRNGVTSLAEVTGAVNAVYGMGGDLAIILAVMGTVFVGDPLSLDPGFSIGGYSPAVENLLGNLFGLLGTPRGLNGSHNIIESDSSITRNDLYMTGDASTMNLTKFMSWYNMDTDSDGNYNMGIMADLADLRFQETVSTNPNFYFGPFTGMIARNAGYIFAGRLLANHSAEFPGGILDRDTLKSFFAVSGDDDNLVYQKGWEKIPENWYRTPMDYNLLDLNLDTIAFITKYPELGSIGGNTGTVNSFTGVDLGNLTGGILNAGTLLEGNNLLCLVFEIVKTLAPNSLSTLFSVLEVPLQLVTETIGSTLLNMSCPAFDDLTVGGQNFADGVRNLFPGAAMGSSAF